MSASSSKRVYVQSFSYEITIANTSHLDSLWRGGKHELGNGLVPGFRSNVMYMQGYKNSDIKIIGDK